MLSWRGQAESNRPARFCRPLPKPLGHVLVWWARQVSNLRPYPCRGPALPAELRAQSNLQCGLYWRSFSLLMIPESPSRSKAVWLAYGCSARTRTSITRTRISCPAIRRRSNDGTDGRTRTCNRRFWRPLRYQLRYVRMCDGGTGGTRTRSLGIKSPLLLPIELRTH